MSIEDHFSEEELKILRARAERAAHAPRERQPDNTLTVLVVALHSETYALPIDAINGAYDRATTVSVPCTPPYVAGIANIRGHITPVLDLAALLGVPGEPAPETSALLVAVHHTMTVAFRVELIGEVTYLLTGSVAPVPESLGIDKSAYLQGVLPDGTILLSMDAIMSDLDLIVEKTPLRACTELSPRNRGG